MLFAVNANDGDEAAISATIVSGELALVTLEISSAPYKLKTEPQPVTLTADKARELAKALISVADAVEFVRTHEFALP